MMDIIIFATAVIVILITVTYFYTGSSRKVKPSTVPGLEPTTLEDGNTPDMLREGSLHQFLMKLHKEFGDIASFYLGRQYCVSICSPELFHEHQGVFDRPPELFKLFEPLIGPKSIQFANNLDGKTRRMHYDAAFSHMKIKHYYGQFQGIADAVAKKWLSVGTHGTEEHIVLREHMFDFALEIVLLTLFGDTFKEEEISKFRRSYDLCWSHMEKGLTGSGIVDNDGQQAFDDGLVIIRKILKHAIRRRKENPPGADEEIMLDLLIDNSADEETLLSDAITYSVGGFHTTGNYYCDFHFFFQYNVVATVLTWCFYYLAVHQEVQDKVHDEIKTQLGQEDVDHTNIDSLVYMKQVLDETLRCSVLAPWGARFQEIDSELGGHRIPKNTPVFHAFGVSLQNEKFWPSPQKFQPDRFSTENVKSRPRLAFQPFGFAGKRICPGYRFAYADATVCLVTLLRTFKVTLVGGQEIKPVYGFVTHPGAEILIRITNRNM